jgi:hypothetical protein
LEMCDILSEIWKFAVIGKVRKKGYNYDQCIRILYFSSYVITVCTEITV